MAKPVLKPVARQPDKEQPIDSYYNITRDKVVVKNAAESYTVGTSGVRRSVKGKYPFYPDGKNREFDKRKWLNVRELAEYIGTTPAGIRSLVYREKIVAYKPFGGMLLFNKADIDRLIESRRATAWYEKD